MQYYEYLLQTYGLEKSLEMFQKRDFEPMNEFRFQQQRILKKLAKNISRNYPKRKKRKKT